MSPYATSAEGRRTLAREATLVYDSADCVIDESGSELSQSERLHRAALSWHLGPTESCIRRHCQQPHDRRH